MNEENLNDSDFFTADEIYKILELVNEKINEVYYHYWVNSAPKDKLEILDYIELRFQSGKKLILSSDSDGDGIKPLDDFDPEKKNESLQELHKGLISISTKNMSKSALWKDCLNKSITPSLLQHDKKHLNDNLVFHFENSDSLEIFLGLEGLEVDVYEE